jgi:MFS family permease
VYGVLVLLGTARAFQGPAASALVPNHVPAADLSNAVAWASTTWQVATIAGPSLGGLSLGLLSPTGVYTVSASAAVFALVNTLRVAPRPAAPRTAEPPMDRLLAGIRYVWRTPVVLGCISLDLFAVLLGGAVALLPVFARDILHAGPWALGVLRSAPAVGAALMALWLAHHPIARHAGRWMLISVAVFGAATVVFGLSSSLAVSVAALAVAGASDMVSVVIRQHAVQVATPDAMRGRVSAVNLVFVGASNELGEFESGVTAQFLGPVRAVVVGGVGTLLVVATWAGLFPALRTLDRLDELGPGEKSAGGA